MSTTTLDRPAGATTPTGDAVRRSGGTRRRSLRIAGAGVVALVLGTEAVLAAPYLGSALTALTRAADTGVGLALLATAGSLTAFALVRRRLLRAAGVPVPAAASLSSILVANALHMTLPGGVAFSTGYTFRWMRRHGAGATVAGWALAVNGLLATATLAGLGLVASLLTGTTGWVRLTLEIAAVAALVLGVGHLVRHPERAVPVARRTLAAVDRLRGRADTADTADTAGDRVGAAFAQLRAVRPTARDWTVASAYALLNWVLDLACLVACTSALGLTGLTASALLATYVAGMAASSLSLLPGGLGVVDAALVLGLVAAGAAAAPALSAVLLYRLIGLVGVVAAGWVVHAVQLSRSRSSAVRSWAAPDFLTEIQINACRRLTPVDQDEVDSRAVRLDARTARRVLTRATTPRTPFPARPREEEAPPAMHPTEHDLTVPDRRAGVARSLVTKVPVVTASFWVLKILTTGMGEAASDALVRWGGGIAIAVTAVALVASFVLQFRAERYVPWIYWLAVAMVGIFGTMAGDIPHFLGSPLWLTSLVYLAVVVVIFAVWYRQEGTLSFDSITKGRSEAFYWAAVMATFALGTAVGDLTADTWHLGNLVSGLMFCGLIVLPLLARRWFGLSYVAAFWTAYVLTRPLGASFADWMGAPTFRGGLGIGPALTAVLWALAMLVVAAFLVVAHRRRAVPGARAETAAVR